MRHLFFTSGVLATLALLSSQIGAAENHLVAMKVPPGWEVVWQADRPEALDAVAKPTLAYADAPGRGFVWTGVDAGGRRWFRLARALWVQDDDGRKTWAIGRLQRDGTLENGGGWHPLTEVEVSAAIPPRKGMEAHPWARLVTADRVHGSVYEIETYGSSGTNGAQGERLLLWCDARGAWKYVGTLPGDMWDNSGFHMWYRVTASFGADPRQPLELRVEERHETPDEPSHEVRWGSTARLGGPLPLSVGRPQAQQEIVEVRAGNTFSGIVREIAAVMEPDKSAARQARARRIVQAKLLAMNPGIDVDDLQVAQLLRDQPSWEWQALLQTGRALENGSR
jgi:hypothetical protein